MTLTATELAQMRQALNSLMPDTCNILSPTNTSDSQGGFTTAWGTITGGTAVACRLDIRTGSEMDKAGQWQLFTAFVLTVPYDTTVLATYRVEHGGITYNVTSVDTDKSWPVTKRVEVAPV